MVPWAPNYFRSFEMAHWRKWFQSGGAGLALLLLLFCADCFFGGIKNPGKVRGYSPGIVKTEKGYYEVGVLPETWRRVHVDNYHVITFRNDGALSTLSTDAFCDQAFDDASLKVLTTHLHFDLSDRKIKMEKPFMLDDRGALRSVVSGKVDGVLVVLDTVVIKKDNCLFDFALVSDPSKYQEAVEDFEKFFNGFKYRGQI